MRRDTVPVSEKYLITVQQASQYFGIGESKLRTMLHEYGDRLPDWALLNGSRTLIKKEKFEKYLDGAETI